MSGTMVVSASWPLPQAADIAGIYAQSYLAAFPGCDPAQPNSFMAVQARAHGVVGFNLYLYQRSLADELMADTARVWLPRHGAQWAVPQIPAVAAIGNVIFSGTPEFALPNGIEFADDDGKQYITTATATIGSGNTVSVPARCESGGIAGNQPAGTVLNIVSPVIGLQNQTVTVDTGGIAGGLDAEAITDWRARILLRIRKRGVCGAAADYIQWAEANGAAPSPNVLPNWAGLGTVGVAFAMPNSVGVDRLVPTTPEVTAMQTALNLVRPVTAQVIAIPAVQTLVPLTIALANDTVVNRANATQAAQAYIAASAIGGLLDHSELEDAVLQATACGVEISVPAANVQATGTQMLAMGTVTFVGYA